jgi:hypothetical protein
MPVKKLTFKIRNRVGDAISTSNFLSVLMHAKVRTSCCTDAKFKVTYHMKEGIGTEQDYQDYCPLGCDAV